jgi:predicted acetyltransferase
MENSVQTDVLFMDFSKAFDKVSHNLLTHKLYYYGMPGKNKNLGYILYNFLSNCTQPVLLEGEASD